LKYTWGWNLGNRSRLSLEENIRGSDHELVSERMWMRRLSLVLEGVVDAMQPQVMPWLSIFDLVEEASR
jgi:hypothetical protein